MFVAIAYKLKNPTWHGSDRSFVFMTNATLWKWGTGKRNIEERPPRKRGNDKKKDVHWISVLVARDRHKHEADFVLRRFTIDQVEDAQ